MPEVTLATIRKQISGGIVESWWSAHYAEHHTRNIGSFLLKMSNRSEIVCITKDFKLFRKFGITTQPDGKFGKIVFRDHSIRVCIRCRSDKSVIFIAT
jgi:hypothetical protein